jgi:D-xylose 1-dehydrogenase (NADP+, D-xylono-1,5-lactone-forming)
MRDRVRLGVLGAANIARKVVIPSILRADGVELVAIASESAKAAEFLHDTQLVTSDGRPIAETVRACTYEELVASDDVDAVYIPLPNHLHAPWSTRAADAGKHVLCEKPAARTRAEAEEAIDHCLARGVVWMEAFMYRFHPQWPIVFDLLAEGRIGELKLVRSLFTFTVTSPENVRRRPEAGGGSLYDVGYYCVNAARWMFGAEPEAVAATMSLGLEGIDEEFSAVLDFGGGRSALIASSFTQPYRHEVELLGTAGSIRVPAAFVNRSDPLTLELENAEGAVERVATPGDDEYRLEVEDFADCVRSGRQPEVVSHRDTLANMAAVDALYEAARSGRRVEL